MQYAVQRDKYYSKARTTPTLMMLMLTAATCCTCSDGFIIPRGVGQRPSFSSRQTDTRSSVLTTKWNAQVEVNNVEACDQNIPEEYAKVLQLLRQAWAGRQENDMPPTSFGRSKIIRSRHRLQDSNDVSSRKNGNHVPSAASFTLANPRFMRKGGNLPKANARFPELAEAVFVLEEKLRRHGLMDNFFGMDPDNLGSASCTVNCQASFLPHVDSGDGAGLSYTVGLGDYRGGDLVIEECHGEIITERTVNIHHSPIAMDGWRQRHWTQPFEGERFSLVWFTAERNTSPSSSGKKKLTKKQSKAQRAAVLVAQRKIKADKVASIAAQYNLVYRPDSTDVEAILEVMGDGDNKPPCYVPDKNWSLQGHVVLDAGCHIGAFSRYALESGAQSVTGYEPEPSNTALARKNLDMPEATLIEAALSNLNGNATLVLGRQRTDGAMNTWRHSLQRNSDKQARKPSRDDLHDSSGKSSTTMHGVETCTVRCFDFYQVLDESKATFVKLDIEGAELPILDKFSPGAWKTVGRLVFEYSFTKRRSLAPFHSIVSALELEGFTVTYDFKGTLLDELEEWPGTTDVLIFCSK